MKRSAKMKWICLLVCMVLMVMTMPAAFAAEPTVRYEGSAEDFVFLDDDDLFDSFKDVMPGDELTQQITVRNEVRGRKVNIYLRALPVADAQVPEGYEQNVAFLEQLTLKVTDETGNTTYFEGLASQQDGLETRVLIASFTSVGEKKLTAQLSVPVTMGNECQYAYGQIDWVFSVEEIPIETQEPDPTPTPIPTTTSLRPVTPAPTASGPAVLPDTPRTGDSSDLPANLLVGAAALCALITAVYAARKAR